MQFKTTSHVIIHSKRTLSMKSHQQYNTHRPYKLDLWCHLVQNRSQLRTKEPLAVVGCPTMHPEILKMNLWDRGIWWGISPMVTTQRVRVWKLFKFTEESWHFLSVLSIMTIMKSFSASTDVISRARLSPFKTAGRSCFE